MYFSPIYRFPLRAVTSEFTTRCNSLAPYADFRSEQLHQNLSKVAAFTNIYFSTDNSNESVMMVIKSYKLVIIQHDWEIVELASDK